MADVNVQLRNESRKLRELMERQNRMMTELYKEKVCLSSIATSFHDEVRATARYHQAGVRGEVSGQGGGSSA